MQRTDLTSFFLRKDLDYFDSLFSLPDMVEELINRVRAEHKPDWIIVIPLLHLLKGTSKPFQPVFNEVSPQFEYCWAGLQGLKSAHALSPRSEDRRY